MTCSRPQRTATRQGLEPGTPWSVVRGANHSASPPPEIIMKLYHACEELVSIAFGVYFINVMNTHECYMIGISLTRERYWYEIRDVLVPILHALCILQGVKFTKCEING